MRKVQAELVTCPSINNGEPMLVYNGRVFLPTKATRLVYARWRKPRQRPA